MVHTINHKKRVIGCFLVLILIIFGAAFGFAVLKSIKAKKEIVEKEKELPPPVYVVAVTNLTFVRDYTALIKADKDITLGAAINGEIKKLYVDIGSVVTQDQKLIEFDERYKKIDVRKAMAEVLESTVALSNAAIDLANNQKLCCEKIIGEDILRKYIVAHRNALAECERDKAFLDYSKEQLKDCIVTAPCEGKISERYVEIGERVNLNQPLLDMVNDGKLKILLFVEGRDITQMFPGKKITFNASIFPDTVFTAAVKNVAANVEKGMRLYRMEAEYDNSSYLLKPGMIVKAKVPIRKFKNIIVIPSSCIDRYDKGDFVTLYDRKNSKRVEVKIGLEYKGWAQILTGLKSGDKVIIK